VTVHSFLGRVEKVGKAMEDGLLVTVLSAMILLAVLQIFLRNLFDLGFIWSDELLRLLVLWLAVAGAVAASRKDRHISIAVLDRFLPESVQKIVRILLDVFTAVVCALIAWHSLAFVRTSMEFGDTMLGNVPAWIPQIIMPVGFALIAWRYTLFAFRGVLGKRLPEEIPAANGSAGGSE
jgi:TRAP-type C4-dicarboxylate transport system permease small subunit